MLVKVKATKTKLPVGELKQLEKAGWSEELWERR